METAAGPVTAVQTVPAAGPVTAVQTVPAAGLVTAVQTAPAAVTGGDFDEVIGSTGSTTTQLVVCIVAVSSEPALTEADVARQIGTAADTSEV